MNHYKSSQPGIVYIPVAIPQFPGDHNRPGNQNRHPDGNPDIVPDRSDHNRHPGGHNRPGDQNRHPGGHNRPGDQNRHKKPAKRGGNPQWVNLLILILFALLVWMLLSGNPGGAHNNIQAWEIEAGQEIYTGEKWERVISWSVDKPSEIIVLKTTGGEIRMKFMTQVSVR